MPLTQKLGRQRYEELCDVKAGTVDIERSKIARTT